MPQTGGGEAGKQSLSQVMVMRDRKAQAYAAGETRRSDRIKARLDAALNETTPAQTQALSKLPNKEVKSSKENRKGKTA